MFSLALAASLLGALPLRAQTSSQSELVVAAAQAPAWNAAGFMRFYDSARAVSAALPRAPEIAPEGSRRSEVSFSVGPRVTRRPPRRISDLRVNVPLPRVTRAYRRTFRLLLRHPGFTDRYDELVLKYARRFHLDARLLKSIMAAESQFVAGAHSPRGARGLMQVLPSTAESVGVPRELLGLPEYNIEAGAAYIAKLFRRAWRVFKLKGVRYRDAPLWLKRRIIAAYNAGPRFLFRHGGWYRQTRDYVRKVLMFYQSRVTDFRRSSPALLASPRAAIASYAGSFY